MVKSRFAGFLRGILRRLDSSAAKPAPVTRPVTAARPVAPVATVAALPPFLVASAPPNAQELAIPLAPIIVGLPLELRGKIVAVPPGMTINLPIETVTTQLPLGAVKISFGKLRQLAPAAFANSGGEHDHKMISLPLGEILPRLNPALLARRTSPKVEVAEDINGPFGGRGSGVAFTTQSLKTSAPAPMPVPTPAPASAPLRMNPPVVSAAPMVFTPPPTPSARAVSPASCPEPAVPTIFALLWDLAETWPEELKNEISLSALANISVPLAGEVVEAGLKRGRVTMPWKQLRALARPSSPPSPNDNVELDLPLKVIAPMFLAAQKNLLRAKPKAAVSEAIPNLFFGFPQAEPEPPVSAPPKPAERKSADTNLFIWGDSRETPKAGENVFAPPPVPQTDFTHSQASPRDVVARAIALPGVVGVLVTLPDGLRVASEVAAEFNADTLAAFIPQIFERMNQSAKELRMGALNNVGFTVGNVPWRIFRVNAVYFAAFGRAGESLPGTQIAALAGELNRKKAQ